MPPWPHHEGAWIAIGVSWVFVIAARVMHHVVIKVLKAPPGDMPSVPTVSKEPTAHE